MNPLGITGLGAVTSVGMDAVTTCASIRAGLSRPAILDGAIVLDLEEYQEVPVTGHPAGVISRGFSNVGRWLQLAPVALRDLCSAASLPAPSQDPTFWSQTKCIIGLPFLDDRFLPDPNCSNDAIEEAFLIPLRQSAQEFFSPSTFSFCARGRIGVLESVAAAGEWIGRGAARVIVLAVDALVDLPALEWLFEFDRVKCDTNPIGLSPGEAACAVMFEDVGIAARRGATVIAQITSTATMPETKAFLDGDRSQGDAMTKVIEQVLLERGRAGTFRGPVVTDLNGEEWRAYEFGCAQMRVDRSLWESGRLILPVENTGDVGAATPGIQIAVACRALARGYAGDDSVLVTCSDEQGFVGAAVIAHNDV